MKQLYKLLVLAVIAATVLPAAAYDFMVDGICYNINADGNSVTVTYERYPYDYDYAQAAYASASGSLTIPSTVSHRGKTYSVTAIGELAFDYCGGFTGSLTIPNSVTSIGERAFEFCGGFTGSLTIPNSVTSIGEWAFVDCCSFTGSLTIGNSVTSIGYGAFSGCSGFTGSLTIPNSVTSIGNSAFWDCSGFTGSLIIPESVSEIGFSAFCNCIGLETLKVATSNPKYDSRDNCNAVIETATNTLVCGIKTFSIPNSVTSIGDYAFEFCSGFTGSLTIPESVTSIGRSAFYFCKGFTGSLTIPNSVTSIGEGAFQYCSGLSSLILTGEGEFKLSSGSMPSKGIVFIQSGITGIKGLRLSPDKLVYSYATTPPECDENSFTTYTATLHVPKRALAGYIDAPYWSNFNNIAGDAVAPEALEWEQESVSLKFDEQLTLSAPVITPGNTGLEVSVTSSNPEVVSLSRSFDYNAGEYVYTIKGLKAGEADIIANCAWLDARMHVTVTEDALTITLDKHELEIEAGAIATLTPSSSPVPVEFAVESSDRSVATARVVNGRVQVVGAKPGVAVITVSDVEGKAMPDSCHVTVIRPVGDATGDGYLDIDDVNAMINVMLDMVPRPEGEELNFYDFDGNGKVDIDDLNQLINILLAQ